MSSHPPPPPPPPSRVRPTGSPTAIAAGGGGGAALAVAAAAATSTAATAATSSSSSSSSRLQPMRATVPFQLKQHGSPTRSGGGIIPRQPPPPPPSPRSASPTRNGARGAPPPPPPPTNGSSSPAVATQTLIAIAAAESNNAGPLPASPPPRSSPPRLPSSPSAPSPASPPPPDPEGSACANSSSSSSPNAAAAANGGGRVRHRQRRRSPEQSRASPERKSPGSPGSKVDKPRPPSSSPSSIARRTPSLDLLAAPYLAGQWPRENHGQAAPCMRDKSTQTESAWAEEYLEKKKGSHKRSASWGSTDQLKEIAKLRQQLQRSKHSSRHHRDKERQSPFHGNHAAINQCQAPVPKGVLVPVIPIAKSTGSRFRNSIEGLNQEIEIIIKETGEKEEQLIPQDVPDGHRAPPPLVQRSSSTRSIDTQTPGGAEKGSNNSSRSQSVSPGSFLAISNEGSEESPCSADDLLGDPREKENGNSSPLPKYATSPKPNNSYMFKREPPEGCEKVKVFEDSLPKPLHEIPAFYCPDKNKVNFIPKSGSAFCLVSILKPLLPTQDLTLKGATHNLTVTSGMTPALLQPISMASLSANTDQDRLSRGTSKILPPMTMLQQPGHVEETEG
ncbi:LOW QUALITY PROTEIN: protein FAM117B [Sceloporus undulatus]|uniref:LOW QUALITY PROTEIN: protein FAM117B n=1 Tax=Sceloporus undulatus TaxID=8520 RepID=UPI001C4C3024|nr:LOW QUALITY PROTEIN: protein FAM117B [Sceloporus undulatus]